MVRGESVLVTDTGEQTLVAGTAAGFSPVCRIFLHSSWAMPLPFGIGKQPDDPLSRSFIAQLSA
jgi:hypothetical protein